LIPFKKGDAMSQRFKRFAAAALLVAACIPPTESLLASGTGGGLQVPNPPEGLFAQPGAPGLCQCIAITEIRSLNCQTSAGQCQSLCRSRVYAFIPAAVQSCPVELPLAQPGS